MIGDLQVSLEGIDVVGGLILGCQTREGHVDGLGVIGVDHGRVALRGGLEELVVSASGEGGDLAAPAEAQDGPGLEASPGGGLVGRVDNAGDLREGLGWGSLSLEEVAELLLVFVGGRRIPRDIGGATLEEVGYEDAVVLSVGSGQDVGSLDGLVEESEDIYSRVLAIDCGHFVDFILTVHHQDGLGGRLRAGDVC